MENLKAIIKDGIVDQIIVTSDDHAATLSGTVVDISNIECAIGWEHDGTTLTPPIDDNIKDELIGEELETFQLNWRNEELRLTDHYVPVTDHPNHANILEYRQRFRDWTSTEDFPLTRPVSN